MALRVFLSNCSHFGGPYGTLGGEDHIAQQAQTVQQCEEVIGLKSQETSIFYFVTGVLYRHY